MLFIQTYCRRHSQTGLLLNSLFWPAYVVFLRWLGSWVVSVLDSGAEGLGFKSQPRCCRVSLRQTVHTHCVSVRQAAKLVAALLRVVMITAGLAGSNGSLLPSLWLMSPAGWLPRTGISSRTLHSVIEYGLPLLFLFILSKSSFLPVLLRELSKVISSHVIDTFQYNLYRFNFTFGHSLLYPRRKWQVLSRWRIQIPRDLLYDRLQDAVLMCSKAGTSQLNLPHGTKN